jgi:hypothetical protein
MTDWGTPGGAMSPMWGDIRLHVWAALGHGRPLRWGVDPDDRLTAGHVWGGTMPGPVTGDSLWIDLSCDVLDLTITSGATRADGVVATAEAGTVELTVADPAQRLDPLNPDSPWRARLQPGVPVLIFTESLQDAGVGSFILRHTLFVGTVESIREPWTPHPSARRARITAVDATAALVALERPELPAAIGAGDSVDARLARILDYHSAPMFLVAGDSDVTLAGTTLDGTAWAQIGDAVDAEVGYVHVTPAVRNPLDALYFNDLVALRFVPRSAWTDRTDPTVTVGSDEVVAATVSAVDQNIRNVVNAKRDGGADVTVRSQSSVDRFGQHSYSATDLQVGDDSQVAQWAEFVLAAFAYPSATLDDVTILPAVTPDLWRKVLGVDLVTEPVEVIWHPPGSATTFDVVARVVGVTHAISHARWSVTWTLAASAPLGIPLRWGVDPDDRLSAGHTFALAPSSTVTYLITETGDLLADENGFILSADPAPVATPLSEALA